MIAVIEIKKNKKKSKFKVLIFIFFLIAIFLFLFFSKKEKIFIFVRHLFISEDLKFIEQKNNSIQEKIYSLLKENKLYDSNSQNTINEISKNIQDNIQLLHYLEDNFKDLKPIYYNLAYSYFFKFIIHTEFTRNELILQIQHGSLPTSQNIDLQELINPIQKYSRKYLSLEETIDPNILIISIIGDILHFKILAKKYLVQLNSIKKEDLNPLFIPYYEWFYLVLNSNFGVIENIQNYFKSENNFWKFKENEKLLILSTTYYYNKDYYNLIQTFFLYKNKFNFLFNNNELIEHNTINKNDIFIHKEFFRLLMETYLIQKNILTSKLYLNQLELLLKKYPDEKNIFIEKRISMLKSKLL